MQEMKVDDVDKVLDEINDQNDQLQQINTAMQTPIGDAANMDEDELTRELEVLAPPPPPSSVPVLILNHAAWPHAVCPEYIVARCSLHHLPGCSSA